MQNVAEFAEIGTDSRIDCSPRSEDANRQTCESNKCIWDDYFENINPTVPLCYYPKETGYLVESFNDNTNIIKIKKSKTGGQSPIGKSFDKLNVTYKLIRSNTLKVSIGVENRFVPPISLNEDSPNRPNDRKELKFLFQSTPIFSFQVKRNDSSNINLWDTSIGGLIFTDQFIQIASYLPTKNVYGFGENVHNHLKHDFSLYQTWGMFSRDEPTDSVNIQRKNYYGVHPFYIGIEPYTGNAHGVFILNSNAQEVTTGPAPHLIYRTIGGQLDIYFFAGPTSEQVVSQYLELIGKPFLPAYWALGFQLCRYGYTGVQEISDTINRTRDAKIPFDIIYSDIDYMNRYKDFSLSKDKAWIKFSDYVDEIHKLGLKLILIVDPGIQVDDESFKRALEYNATFISWARQDLVQLEVQNLYPTVKNTKFMLGVVWPDKHVAFPDFLDSESNTENWWKSEFKLFYEKIKFDGIWLDMNEPSNFETNKEKPNYPDGHPVLIPLKCSLTGKDSKYDNPPYKTASALLRNEKFISEKTLCMNAVTGRGQYKLYDTHSLYGLTQLKTTNAVLRSVLGKRFSLFSRSTFPGSGVFGGHWLGDNFATWLDLRNSIIGVIEFNLFGIPFVGADVCGFNGDSNEELCLRWQQLGAFYPFYRNHNSIGQKLQDPAQWPSVAQATRAANVFRYKHLPYLYSLLFRASLYGETVVRPLFFEYSNDEIALDISHEFLWGTSLLIIPVTTPNTDYVHSYLPVSEIWYSASTAHQYGFLISSGFSDFNAPRNSSLPVFIKGGSIVPQQKPGLTIAETRENEFMILVALSKYINYVPQQAFGELFWDDGNTLSNNLEESNYIQLQYSITVDKDDAELIINCTHKLKNKINLPTLDVIEIFGYNYKPNFQTFRLNNKTINIQQSNSSYSEIKKNLIINAKNLIDFNKNGPVWTLSWGNVNGHKTNNNNDKNYNFYKTK